MLIKALKCYIILLTASLTCLTVIVHGQQDTTRLKKEKVPVRLTPGNFYVIDGNLVLINKDTTVYTRDTSKIHFSQRNKSLEDSLLKKLKTKASNNIITRELYNQLIRENSEPKKGSYVRGDKAFVNYKNKTIRSINLSKKNIYSNHAYDTLAIRKYFQNFSNTMHVNTQDWKIRNSLLFEPGDRVDPLLLADNERLLRQLPFIQRANIILSINPADTNEVIATIITQDAFPLTIGGTMYDYNRGRLDITHKNIVGTGHRLASRVYLDASTTQKSGYHGKYQVQNINHTFVNGVLEYYDVDQTNWTGVKAFRQFISPEINYAGEISFYSYKDQKYLEQPDTLIPIPLKYNRFNSWIGRSFSIQNDSKSGARKSLNLSGRVKRVSFSKRPKVTADTNPSFYNYNRYLFKAGFSKQRFFKSNMIYNSGIVEDIPTGILIELTGGFEKNDYYTRPYFAAGFSVAKTTPDNYYFYSRAEAGSFFNGKSAEQSTLRFNMKAFSPLYHTQGPLIRQFVSANLLRGFNHYPYTYTQLDGKNGLRSFPSKAVTGKYRMVLSLETVIFPRLYYYGFGGTFFTFLDMGITGDSMKQFYNDKLYSSIGAGFRIRNDNFVFNSVEIRLTYIPVLPDDKHFSFYLSSEQTLNIDNFNPGIPEVLPFDEGLFNLE